MKTAIDLLRFAGRPGMITIQEDTTIYMEPSDLPKEAMTEDETTEDM